MLDEYPDVLTIMHLKEILHYSSNTTVYKLIKEGKIKAVHSRGNKYLIPKKYLIDYLLDK